LTISIKRS